MPSISAEDIRYFENKIYLPLLITLFERDRESIVKLPFKLSRPYLAKVEGALQRVRADLKVTEIYLTRHNMQLIIEKSTKESSEYAFIHAGYEERKRYTSAELRKRSEELMLEYLSK
ncbi:hypothetical protein [Psychrobacillus sp. OK032]|uniref:hypothetical protein n=1 Tax=Psychrobacillus sp. OK032 TaxID=1884358 RepID=UPI0008AC10F3|nr:hypothetical protein [Psychrobacillus sp. OK032]SER87048.1 hypothetical protein SAMN05518872_102417 [Psychrobacillus sp. OK032]